MMSFSRRVFLFYHLITLWVGGALGAQSTQLFYQQFTTEDGLPSSETYVSIIDREGLLWVGTDNGVASFNGYEFTVYDTDDGLADAVVYTLQEGANGKIWAGTNSGRVFYYQAGRFHPYAQNDFLAKLREDNSILELLDVLASGELVIKVNKAGILKINEAGEIEWLTNEDQPTIYLYVPEREPERITKQRRYHVTKTYPDDKSYQVVRWNGAGWDFLGMTTLVRGPLRAVFPFVIDLTWKGEGVILFGTDRLHQLVPGRAERVFEYNGLYLSSVLPRADGSLLSFVGAGGGMQRITLDSKQQIIKDVYLAEVSFASGYEDPRGGLWVNSLDAGIFYFPYPDQLVYAASELKYGQKAVAVATINENEFFASYANGSIFYYDTKNDKKVKLAGDIDSLEIRSPDLLFDEKNQVLLASSFHANYQAMLTDEFSSSGIIRYLLNEKRLYNFGSLSKITAAGDKYCWNNSHDFGTLDPATGSMNPIEERDFSLDKHRGIESFFIDKNDRKWVGTLQGLKEYIPGQGMVANNLGLSALTERIVAIRELANDFLLFATRGEGLVFYRKDTSFQIKMEDGLASNLIRNIHIDISGDIWVATLTGLSKVMLSTSGNAHKVKTYTSFNGLVSEEVYDVDTKNDIVWLATAKGAMFFKEPPIDTISIPPRIEAIVVNDQPKQVEALFQLTPDQENISISYVTTDFRLFDKVKYRFRTDPTDKWVETKERTVNFSNLKAGEYFFEVQSQNVERNWSKSTTLAFSIAKPWYETWPARILGLIIFAGLLSQYFIRRERKRRWEQDLLLQINKLEHEALHAQMNPHFVFNALNSIQNFVLHNDAKQAATYLSRFALVIRQTLRSSVKGQHALAEEIEMLKTYLLLEKLRFKEGFDYEVMVAPGLHPQEVFMPPLLIQPFVENAILHGLSETSSGGLIKVVFTGNAELLEVEIQDNGTGFVVDQEVDEESLGMTITRRRLEMMKNKNKQVSGMWIEPRYAEDGKMAGTRVVLRIYLEVQRGSGPDVP